MPTPMTEQVYLVPTTVIEPRQFADFWWSSDQLHESQRASWPIHSIYLLILTAYFPVGQCTFYF